MPDLAQRTKFEREVAAAIVLLFDDFEEEAYNGKRFRKAAFAAAMKSSMRPILADVHRESANQLAGMQDFETGPDGKKRAKDWSSKYASRLALQFADTTDDAVAAAMKEVDATIRGEKLDRIFGRERALNVGATEVTTAITRGEMDAADLIRRDLGVRLVPVWETEDDGRECEVCARYHGMTRALWGRKFPLGPPAHPVCRCRLGWGVPTRGGSIRMLESLVWTSTQWFVFEAWNDSDHPRDDRGRFVSTGTIEAAKNDPTKAKALRDSVTRPSQRAKLDKLLGGSEGGKQAAKSDAIDLPADVEIVDAPAKPDLQLGDTADGGGFMDAKAFDAHPAAKKLGVTAEGAGRLIGAPAGTKVTVLIQADGSITIGAENDAVLMNRTVSMEGRTKVITNDYFELTATGTGEGTKIFAAQVAEAHKNGFNKIKTLASRSEGMNGYYTWARLGYDAELDAFSFHGPTVNEARQVWREKFPNAKRISDLMKTADGREFWKQYGGSFEGEFDTRPTARSRKVLDAYIAEKANAATPGAEPPKTPVRASRSAPNPSRGAAAAVIGLHSQAGGPGFDSTAIDRVIPRLNGMPITELREVAAQVGARPGRQPREEVIRRIREAIMDKAKSAAPPASAPEAAPPPAAKPRETLAEMRARRDAMRHEINTGVANDETRDRYSRLQAEISKRASAEQMAREREIAAGTREPEAKPRPNLPPVVPVEKVAGLSGVVVNDESDEFQAKQNPTVRKIGGDPKNYARAIGAPDGAEVNVYADETEIQIRAKAGPPLYDELGNKLPNADELPVIEMSRRITNEGGKIVIHNDLFLTKNTAPGTGTAIFAAQVAYAESIGAKKIVTSAAYSPPSVYDGRVLDAGMNGYYTWPRLGYDGAIKASNLRGGVTAMNEMERKFPGVKRVSELMATADGRDWWKRNGDTIELEFDMTPGSRSRKILSAYVAEKAKK